MRKDWNEGAEWTALKSKLAVGSIVKGEVFAHMPFGVFVQFDSPFLGLIEIISFKENGERMTPREYPELGAPIRAVVLGFRDRNHQIELSARPSDLKAASKHAGKRLAKQVKAAKSAA